MLRASVLRSTPLRLAGLFASLFIVAFLVSGGAAYQNLKSEISLRDDRIMKENFDVYAASFQTDGIQDLTNNIKLQINATGDGENIYFLAAPDGTVLAGNVTSITPHPGWSSVDGSQFGMDADLTFRLYEGSFSGYRLVLGINNEDTTALEEIAVTSFGWASLVSLCLAIIGAALIASQARQRLEAVRGSINLIGQGDLSARIPLVGKGDDLDILAGDINGALERLSHLVEGMRQVSNDIAHELKSPLNRLKINLETAREKQAKGKSVSKELDASLKEADGINDTFAALLRIAQIESGARKARFAIVDLNEILSDVTEVYTDVAQDAGMTLSFAPYAAPAPIWGDRDLITQMTANLVENCIRHCQTGAVISVALDLHGKNTRVTIADNGPGIPQAERENVLRRLYRLEQSRTTPGSGLGLSLVKAIADLHSATLVLDDNNPGLRATLDFAAIKSTANA
jgi:signal transduction histidine kinase